MVLATYDFMILTLNSILIDTNIAMRVFYWLIFAWWKYFYFYNFKICVTRLYICLKCIISQHYIAEIFKKIISDDLCILTRNLKSVYNFVITDIFGLISTILNYVSSLLSFSHFFRFFPNFSWNFPHWFRNDRFYIYYVINYF